MGQIWPVKQARSGRPGRESLPFGTLAAFQIGSLTLLCLLQLSKILFLLKILKILSKTCI
jgi:hypothetical protein